MTGLDTTLREQPLVAIPLLFGAGLVTSLTPCVYPLISVTVAYFGTQGRERGVRVMALAETGCAANMSAIERGMASTSRPSTTGTLESHFGTFTRYPFAGCTAPGSLAATAAADASGAAA